MHPLVAAVAALLLVASNLPFHKVTEGHVGVYWRGGKLLEATTQPGIQVMIPLLDSWEEVQVTTQTDSVTDIPCGTSGGVMVYIDKIEVVNLLNQDSVISTIKRYGVNYDKLWIFDKIHHEINQFCSKHTLHEVYIEKFDQLDDMLKLKLQEGCDAYKTGIDIMAVRVTKPNIPHDIKATFMKLEEAKQTLLLKAEQQKLNEIESKIKLQTAKAEATRTKAIKEIELETLAMEAKKQAQQDEIKAASIRAAADAEAYRIQKLAEADTLRLTDRKLREVLYRSLANSTKIYFGESIPNMFTPFFEESVKPNPAGNSNKK